MSNDTTYMNKNMTPSRIYAEDRDESEACQASTPGCSIDHTAEILSGPSTDSSCETW